MAYSPTDVEVTSKSGISWIANGEAADESVSNRPINDVANFTQTVKTNAIFSDASKKGLTYQTIVSPLTLQNTLTIATGENLGIQFPSDYGNDGDSASVTLSKDVDGNQFLKLKCLNDSGDQIQLGTSSPTGLKAAVYDTNNNFTAHTIYHSGNDGKDSGIDSDKLWAMSPDSLAVGNTIVNRNSLGNFSANEITANKFKGPAENVYGIVSVENGGTGYNSFKKGDILLGDVNIDNSKKFTVLTATATGNKGKFLRTNGELALPTWEGITASNISGVLPVENGGTGVTTISGLIYGNDGAAMSAATGLQIAAQIGNAVITNAENAGNANSLIITNDYVAKSFNTIKGFGDNLNDIKQNGSTDLGISEYTSRIDHVHPSDSSKIDKTGGTFSGPVVLSHGVKNGVALSFDINESDTGIYYKGTKTFSISAGLNDAITVSPTVTTFADSIPVSLPAVTTIGNVTAQQAQMLSDLNPAKGNVQAQIDAASCVLPSGSVLHTAGQNAPMGFIPANGAAISRVQYAALFSVIGTIYGAGNGSTTFNLPDLRGEFIRGWDNGRGVDAGRALGSFQAQQVLKHKHVTSFGEAWASGEFGSSTSRGIGSNGGIDYDNFKYFTNDGSDYNYAGQVNPVGAIGSENRPRNIALLACIKY